MEKYKFYISATAGLLVVILVSFVYIKLMSPSMDSRTASVESLVSIDNDDLSLSFSYPGGESAYVLVEPPIPEMGSDGLKKAYIIMDNQEYLDYQSSTKVVDTPLTVSIFVLEEIMTGGVIDGEKRSVRLLAWAERNPQYTAFFGKQAEPEIIKLDGLEAQHYIAGEETKQDIYLFSYRGSIYVFVGQFKNETDDIYQMYKELINSVVFL